MQTAKSQGDSAGIASMSGITQPRCLCKQRGRQGTRLSKIEYIATAYGERPQRPHTFK